MKNMKKVVVWLDHSKAIILHKDDDGMRREIVESEYDRYPRTEGEKSTGTRFGEIMTSNNEHREHNRLKNELHEYFRQLGDKLKAYDYIALWGPGVTKNQLHNFLESHKDFEKKSFDLEALEKITENQLDAKAELFYEMR